MNITFCLMERLGFVRMALFSKLHYDFYVIANKTLVGTDKGHMEE